MTLHAFSPTGTPHRIYEALGEVSLQGHTPGDIVYVHNAGSHVAAVRQGGTCLALLQPGQTGAYMRGWDGWQDLNATRHKNRP